MNDIVSISRDVLSRGDSRRVHWYSVVFYTFFERMVSLYLMEQTMTLTHILKNAFMEGDECCTRGSKGIIFIR